MQSWESSANQVPMGEFTLGCIVWVPLRALNSPIFRNAGARGRLKLAQPTTHPLPKGGGADNPVLRKEGREGVDRDLKCSLLMVRRGEWVGKSAKVEARGLQFSYRTLSVEQSSCRASMQAASFVSLSLLFECPSGV